MLMKYFGILVFALIAFGASAAPSSAMSMKECSAKYQDAKKGGTLNGQDWNAFRAAQCGAEPAAPAGDATAAAAAPAATDAPAAPAAAKAAASTPSAPAIAPPGLVLPSAIDAKYATEKPARGRLHTCADAYKAAKKDGKLQGLKWIQKGGGFYSLCNKKIKSGA